MTPYYQDETVTLYHGDCREILPQLDGIDAVICDPPYDVGADVWDKPSQDIVMMGLRQTAGPVVAFGAAARLQQDLLAFTQSPDRVLIWNVSFSLSPAQSDGIFYRWHPIYCWQLPKQHDGPKIDVLSFGTDGHNWWDHRGTKPLDLMDALIGLAPSGGTLCDPVAGSGTTLCAAIQRGRKAIGIELEERYCEIIVKRIHEAQGKMRVFDGGIEQPALLT